jgi:serine/threonine protein kinase
MGLPILNLKSVGMNWIIDPKKKESLPPDFMSRITRFRSDDQVIESRSGVIYTKKDVLGRGSYGIVHSCVRSTDNRLVAVKTMNAANVEDLIQETVIQAIIYEFSKDLKHPEIGLTGPYCPALYEVGYDETNGESYIVSELMRATTYKLLTTHDGYDEELERLVPTILMQVSTILNDLYLRLGFNHRDFKSDNCMYIRNQSGAVQVRLIDFGFSCINYGKVQISGGGGMFKFCSLKSRDLTQFIYEIYKFHSYLPDDLREVLKALLTFKDGDTVCHLDKKCEDMKEWRDIYSFLNSEIANPNGTPGAVFKVFKAYSKKKDWRKALAYTPNILPREMPAVPIACPPNKVYNPLTQRCVKADGAIGTRLLAAVAEAPNKRVSAAAIAIKNCSKEKPNYNPKTRRCVKACPNGKMRNSSFKCVKPASSISGS